MSNLKKLITPLLLTPLALPAQARWFEVEVLLFSRNQDPTQLSEDFTQSRFVPMSIRKDELLSSVLLKPSDCPEPEPEVEDDPTQYDEFGFPISPEEPTEQTTDAIDNVLTEIGALPAHSANSPTEGGGSALTENSESTPNPKSADSNVQLDEFGFPVEIQPERSPEEQAAYEQWLAECEKPAELNGYDLLPTTIASHQLPLNDNKRYVIPAEQLKLTKAFSKLNDKADYKALLHTGWRMNITSKRKMPAIRLVAGKNFGQQFNVDGWEHIELVEQESVTHSEERVQHAEGSLPVEDSLPAESSLSVEDSQKQETIENRSALVSMDANSQNRQQGVEGAVAPVKDTISKAPTLDGLLTQEQSAIVPDNIDWQIEPPKPPRKPAVWEMQADIRIWLASWLHMEVQSTLRREGRKTPELKESMDSIDVQAEEDGGTLVTQTSAPYLYSYHMDQFRRVRSKELHYFDHPMMGMVIRIIPYAPRPYVKPAANEIAE